MTCTYRHISLTYVQKLCEPKMYVMKWWILGRLSTNVRYAKWPSALAYDEMTMKWRTEHSRNKRWVTMKNKGSNNEEGGENHDVRLMYMMRAISNAPK